MAVPEIRNTTDAQQVRRRHRKYVFGCGIHRDNAIASQLVRKQARCPWSYKSAALDLAREGFALTPFVRGY